MRVSRHMSMGWDSEQWEWGVRRIGCGWMLDAGPWWMVWR